MESELRELAEISISYSPGNPENKRPRVRCSGDADAILRKTIPSLEHREYFYLLCLNRANQCLGYYQVSAGGLSGTVADIRIIFQTALKANASSLIVGHNHPSGNLNPSEADKSMTKRIVKAGKFLEIPLLDHLILTSESYFSFADQNLL